MGGDTGVRYFLRWDKFEYIYSNYHIAKTIKDRMFFSYKAEHTYNTVGSCTDLKYTVHLILHVCTPVY